MGRRGANDERRAVVIGAGIGGLLAAGFLCRHGWSVTVLERLGFLGGKFTQIDYEGFAVPTGAFHMLPGGVRGPVMQALGRLGLSVDAHSMSAVLYLEQARRGKPLQPRLRPMYPRLRPNVARLDSMFWAWGLRDVAAFERLGLFSREVRRRRSAGMPPPPESLQAVGERFGLSARAGRVLSRITEFSTGTPADAVDFTDLGIVTAAHGGQTPCILTHGCRSVIEALAGYVRECGGQIRARTSAARIAVEDGQARGVGLAGGEALPAELVVSSIGGRGTLRLLGGSAPRSLSEKVAQMVSAWGATWSARASAHFLEHDAVSVPAQMSRIAGYVEISRCAPELAPPGQAYLLAYQHLDPAQDVPVQLREGRADLMARFDGLPGFGVFNCSTFRKGYPAAKTQPRIGQTGKSRYAAEVEGVEGLVTLGEDSQGDGVAAEVIGSAALAFDDRLGEM